MARLLLVEDNEMNRDMLRRRLEKRGHAVEVAVDGASALAQTLALLPELVLLDLGLPDISGWEVAKRLKEDPKTSLVPVLALSAHAMAEERQRAMAAGCDEYDTKPVDMERLMGKIAALLAGKKT